MYHRKEILDYDQLLKMMMNDQILMFRNLKILLLSYYLILMMIIIYLNYEWE